MPRFLRHLLLPGAALLPALVLMTGVTAQDPAPSGSAGPPPPGKKKPALQDEAQFVGATVCRNCHKNPKKGGQFQVWARTPHPDALETLATAAARSLAAGRGIAEPAQAAECLRCHQTGHGADPKRFNKTFRTLMAVQCESCHGPGGEHVKLRTRALAAKADYDPLVLMDTVPGEISLPTEATCRGCHNPESPTFQGFDYEKALPWVAHPNPLRPRHRAAAAQAGAGKAED